MVLINLSEHAHFQPLGLGLHVRRVHFNGCCTSALICSGVEISLLAS